MALKDKTNRKSFTLMTLKQHAELHTTKDMIIEQLKTRNKELIDELERHINIIQDHKYKGKIYGRNRYTTIIHLPMDFKDFKKKYGTDKVNKALAKYEGKQNES